MRNDAIKKALLKAISNNPGTNPSRAIQLTYGVSRQAVLLHINALIADGLIRAEGQARGRSYFLMGPMGQTASAPLLSSKLEERGTPWETLVKWQGRIEELTIKGEDGIYAEVLAPHTLPLANQGLSSRLQYVSTEILNNVIDHSSGENYRIFVKRREGELRLEIEDDGIGVFKNIQEYFKLNDFWEAIGELAKGKRTTDPSKHAGEGLFFAARMADSFAIEANSLKYIYVSSQDDWSMGSSINSSGSRIALEFDALDYRSPRDVFERFTDEYEFKEKSPRLLNPYIISLPSGHLPSRSEAKKVLAGAERFSSIVIDFKGVESIGQGFADEVFRVFQLRFPDIQIETKNASEFILRMIAHVLKR